MRHMRHTLSALSLLIILSLVTLIAASAPQVEAQGQQQNAQTVVFVLSANALPSASMEPILIIEQGQYKTPIAGDSDSAEITKFGADYYRKGQKYRVLFGGGDAGTLTVKKATPDMECSRTAAEVALQSKVGLNRNVMALATNSEQLGRKTSSRRAPTPTERAAIMSLARKAYQQNGVPASLLQGIQTINLTATDLDNDGKAELIGSYVVSKTKGAQARYLLFLLAEPAGDQYRTGLAHHEKLTNESLMGGLSLDDMVQGSVLMEKLVDQLDLDNDGVGEVITVTSSFEGVTYTFYKKQPGGWKTLYESGGYRCAF
jgi:hypothetical protein